MMADYHKIDDTINMCFHKIYQIHQIYFNKSKTHTSNKSSN